MLVPNQFVKLSLNINVYKNENCSTKKKKKQEHRGIFGPECSAKRPNKYIDHLEVDIAQDIRESTKNIYKSVKKFSHLSIVKTKYSPNNLSNATLNTTTTIS